MSKFLNDDGSLRPIVVRGRDIQSDLIERLSDASLDFTTDGASQISLQFRENTNLDIMQQGLFTVGGASQVGTPIDVGPLFFEAASVEVGSEDTGITLKVAARAQGAMHIMRKYNAGTRNNVSPTEWARGLAAEKGLKFVGQDSASQFITGQDPKDATPWAALQRMAADLGYIVFEAGGTLYFGQPTWITQQAPKRTFTWRGAETTDPLISMPAFRRTGDTTVKDAASVTLQILATEVEDLLPGMAVEVKGVPYFENTYMVTKVSYSLGPGEIATVNAEIPVNPEAKAVASNVSTVAGVSAAAGWRNPGAGRYGNVTLNATQVNNAFTIASVARDRGLLMPRAAVMGLACAMQEQKLKNEPYGDRDSVGAFQQRPSQGWGSQSQIMNLTYAAGKFYDALVKIKNWQTRAPITEVIADVQRPAEAYRHLYQQWVPMAEALVAAMTVNVQPVATGGGSASSAAGQVEQFVQKCLAQAGDTYRFGAEVRLSDPNPSVFDCSELVEWACYQVGVKIPDGSQNQRRVCKAFRQLSIAQAMKTRGALVFTSGHVAVSLGNGQTIEAKGRKYGVVVDVVGKRFTDAGLIPGMSGYVVAS